MGVPGSHRPCVVSNTSVSTGSFCNPTLLLLLQLLLLLLLLLLQLGQQQGSFAVRIKSTALGCIRSARQG